MKVRKDIIKNEFNVSLSEEEIENAFQSYEDLIHLMYEIAKNTYGKAIADAMFQCYK